MWDTSGLPSYLGAGVTPPTPNATPAAGNGYGAPQPVDFFQSLIGAIQNKQSGVQQAQPMGQQPSAMQGDPNVAASNSARGGLSALSGALGGGAGGGLAGQAAVCSVR